MSLLLVLAIVIAVIIQLATSSTAIAASGGLGSPELAPLVFFAAEGLYNGLLIGALVAACLRYAAMANEQGAAHIALLRARILERHQAEACARAAGDKAAAADAAGTAVLLAGVADAVASDVAIEPVRLVGLPASWTLLRALLAGLGSLFAAAARLLFK